MCNEQIMKKLDYKLIVSSGPTREWIDPVRFISNPSTGRTGWEIASQGMKIFNDVIYISGPVSSKFSIVDGAKNILVDTTEEMACEVYREAGNNCVLIMAAAPADFTARITRDHKIKKTTDEAYSIELIPTKDILKGLIGHTYSNFIRVGFAAETNDVDNYAKEKLIDKDLDYICANRVFKQKIGFGENNANSLHVFSRSGWKKDIGPGSKTENAIELLNILIDDISH